MDTGKIEVKSKFNAEFRRFSVQSCEVCTFEDFRALIEKVHSLKNAPFFIFYTDPKDGDLLPINNDDNLAKAIQTANLLRIVVQKKSDSFEGKNFSVAYRHNLISSVVKIPSSKTQHLPISNPYDFRRVSAIIDVDIVPKTCRRVRLLKHGSDKPLGFYIRDGISIRFTESGVKKVPGIFVSRVLAGGLAASTGLLAANDEVLEVNGIEVSGKSLDQVKDMMIANSSNLIITVKPENKNVIRRSTYRNWPSRDSKCLSSYSSCESTGTTLSTDSVELDNAVELDNDYCDQDQILDFTNSFSEES